MNETTPVAVAQVPRPASAPRCAETAHRTGEPGTVPRPHGGSSNSSGARASWPSCWPS